MPQTTEKQQPIVAGDTAVLARRYANALFDLADEQKALDAVAADMRALRILLNESAEFRYVTSQPRLTRAQLTKAMASVASTAKLNALTGKFLALLAKNRRLAIIAAAVNAFLNALAERRGEFTADVCTAQALTSQQQEKLAANLQSVTGGKVHLTVREDKSLIGGITVKLGSRLIDASVRTKLQRLERQLKQIA